MFEPDRIYTSESQIAPEVEEHYEKIATRLRNGESVSLADIPLYGTGWFLNRLSEDFPEAQVTFKQ